MNDKGRWFRVYARQIREHPKFRNLSGLELGAWLALRSEAELRDKALFPDVDEAVLALRRRRLPNPRPMLLRLIELRLFDVNEDGTVTVHDRADHDRPRYPSDEPDAVAERQRRSRAGHESVTTRDEHSHDTHAGVQPQQAAPATAISLQPQPAGLPSEDDSATAACRLFLNGGEWLSNREYVAAWDDLDRRFSKEWVQSEIGPAYAAILSKHPKVKPWDLKRMVEFRCAERTRAEEREREDRIAAAQKRETDEIRAKAEAASDEEKHRAAVMRRAVGLWMKNKPNEPVPTEYDELEAWLERNEAA